MFQQPTIGSVRDSAAVSEDVARVSVELATELACQQYLAACQWPDGFVCPRCGNRRAYELVRLRRWQCAGCRHQVSLAAGTILHNTKTPLAWFWAAYLMATCIPAQSGV
jgi:transposase-like protein